VGTAYSFYYCRPWAGMRYGVWITYGDKVDGVESQFGGLGALSSGRRVVCRAPNPVKSEAAAPAAGRRWQGGLPACGWSWSWWVWHVIEVHSTWSRPGGHLSPVMRAATCMRRNAPRRRRFGRGSLCARHVLYDSSVFSSSSRRCLRSRHSWRPATVATFQRLHYCRISFVVTVSP